MFDNKRNGRIPTKYREKQKQRAKPVRQQKQTREELEKYRIQPKEVRLKNELIY
jgi:hypothetical protein